MAAKRDKKAVPKPPAVPRQNKTVAPRFKPIFDRGDYAVFAKEDFTADGKWNQESLFNVRKQNPGRNIVFTEAGSPRVFVDRKQFTNPDGSPKVAPGLSAYGKMLGYYDMPKSDPSHKEVVPAEKKPERLDKIAEDGKVRIIKVKTSSLEQKKINKELAEKLGQTKTGKADGNTAPIEVPGKVKQNRYEKAEEKAIRKRVEKRQKAAKKVIPKRISPHPRQGELWDGKRPLGKHQYVGKRTGRVYYASRKRMRERTQTQKRLAAQFIEKRDRAVRASLAKHNLGVDNAVARKAALAASKERRIIRSAARWQKTKTSPAYQQKLAVNAQLRHKIEAQAQKQFMAHASKLAGFGKKPIAFALARSKLARPTAGKVGAIKTLPHQIRYPSMSHSGATPLRAPVSMRSLGGRQTLIEPEMQSRVKGTTLFGTERTLSTGRFPYGGQGVFFRIDAEQVLANLSIRYPAAIRKGVVRASEAVGRKLLDIVEPYVPKDMGLMYTTAKTNSGQTASGGVEMEDGEGYAEAEMSGVSISYNTPYAEIVYFDEEAAHGEAYNRKHKTSEKGEKETARWIEVAFEQEGAAIKGLLGEYAAAVTMALSGAGVARIRNG